MRLDRYICLLLVGAATLFVTSCSKNPPYTVSENGFLYLDKPLRTMFDNPEPQDFYLYDKRGEDKMVGVIKLYNQKLGLDAFSLAGISEMPYEGMNCVGNETVHLDENTLQFSHDAVQWLLCSPTQDHTGFAFSRTGTAYKPAFKKGEVLFLINKVDKHTKRVIHSRVFNVSPFKQEELKKRKNG